MGKRHSRDDDPEEDRNDDPDRNDFRELKRQRTHDEEPSQEEVNNSAGSPFTPRTDSIVTVHRPADWLSSSPISSTQNNRHYNEDGYRLPWGLKTQKGLFLRKNAGTEAAISETTASLEVALRKHLNQLYEMQPSIEDCLQTASSVLLDIFSSPDSPSKDAWRKAARGVRLLEDGLSFLTEAKNLLS
ncbi:uncharacterized protein LOC110769313 [Prunus avium]|uniref:Uncharacterized protein LOC110769313 n=1 Tax=Prunus avium TaxID=42229 RepID=A0A6P5TPJ4_PRUAV|nr:uncharacterized protein LOC110769313 [Prunus avium]